jgi:hypothetical protein
VSSKCDKRLDWWFRLANLYHERVPHSDPNSADPGFSRRVHRLAGPRPHSISVMLDPAGIVDDLIAWGNDPDQSLWDVAGVANAVLSRLAEPPKPARLPLEITLMDWSRVAVPLTLSISAEGRVTQAYRPEPMAELLGVIAGKSLNLFGICPVCKKLFQRLRRDQQCDDRRCRDAHRQRRFRARQSLQQRPEALTSAQRNKKSDWTPW